MKKIKKSYLFYEDLHDIGNISFMVSFKTEHYQRNITNEKNPDKFRINLWVISLPGVS